MAPVSPPDCVSYLRHPALSGVELIIASPSSETRRMLHERYLLCSCSSAATSWVYRRKTHLMEDGLTGFMEPGETHRVVGKLRPAHYAGVFFDREKFLRLAEQAGFSGVPHFRVAQVGDVRLHEGLIGVAASLKQGEDILKVQSQLAALVRHALTYAERRAPAPRASKRAPIRLLDRARDYLEEHLYEPVTLDQLAAAAAVSRFHLARSFMEHFGIPPHAYVLQRRINRACALLRSGVPCVEVASSVGFADQSHFTRHFKKIMGVTPARYAHPSLPGVPERAT